jgi:hypothetical protein
MIPCSPEVNPDTYRANQSLRFKKLLELFASLMIPCSPEVKM